MKKQVKIIFLLSVIFLTAVFLSKINIKVIEASETESPKLRLLDFRQEEEKILIDFAASGFSEDEPLQVKVYIKDGDKKGNYQKLHSQKLEIKEKIKEKISLSIPVEFESSGFYFLKIRVAQKDRKAVLEGKEKIYLKGNFAKDVLLQPKAYFEDDILKISWTDTEDARYRVDIYDKKSKKLIKEIITDKKEVDFALPKQYKNAMIGVARSFEGGKGDFKLFSLPDRELPNTMVRFESDSIFKQDETEVDIIYTGKCFSTIEIGQKTFLKQSPQQGRFKLPLPEGEVEIKVRIEADNGNVKTYRKKVFVDTIFPELTLDGELNGAVTGDESIVISGSCSEEAALTLNGEPLSFQEKNRFSTKFSLNEGENDIKLVAKDRAGNITNLRAVVKREVRHEPNGKIVLLVFGTFGLIFLAYFVTFVQWVRAKKRRKS